MVKVSLGIERDGFVKASYLESVLTEVARAVSDELNARAEEIAKLRADIDAVRRELEAERRLRLGMSGRSR